MGGSVSAVQSGRRRVMRYSYQILSICGFSPDVSQVTLWDLVKEGSLDQLIVVLDSLQDQVNFSILYIYGC